MLYHHIFNVGTQVHSPVAAEAFATLALAQPYAASEAYAEAIHDKLSNGDRVIMDNGAHEGIDIDLEEYAHILIECVPTVAVMTDLVGRPSRASRDRSLALIGMVEALDYHGQTEDMTYMFVPQGESAADVVDGYNWAFDNLSPDRFIIGIGQGYLQFAGPDEVNNEAPRMRMLDEISKLPGFRRHYLHVLGARWHADGARYDQYLNIIGIDSIKPCTCAAAGLLYPSRPSHRSVDRMSETVVDTDALRDNIQAFCNAYHCHT